MSVKDLLDNLDLDPKTEGSQFIIDCPVCGKKGHCYVDNKTGLWHCKVCDVSGNTFQLLKHFKPASTPKETVILMEKYNIRQVDKQPEKEKDLSWLRPKLKNASDDDIARLCKAKGINADALRAFTPLVSRKEPVMYLPGFIPGRAKPVGFLRVHLDGELVQTKNGKQKYPIIGKWGLLGLKAAVKSDTIIFAEGWRDALAAIEAGYTAIANTGGTGWLKEWLSLFWKKMVYIIPDADRAGLKTAYERAEAIAPVAKRVSIVLLPFDFAEKSGRDLYDYLNQER